MERQNFKLTKDETFLSASLLENIIKETDIKKATIEEGHSELWFETLHGRGKITFNNDIIYEGSLKYGLLHTEKEDQQCTISFPNGTGYSGTVINNKITGTGTYMFPKGSTYVGGVGNGLRHGYGVFTSSTGTIYEGEWSHGLKHGKGKITQGNMIGEGEWNRGIISGQSLIKWKSGNIYEGNVLNNEMHGNGFMIWYTIHEKFTGQWLGNKQNGFGVHIWYESKGDFKFGRERYIGQWNAGMRHGYGRFYYANGSGYEGYWKNNHKDGFGVLIAPDTTRGIGNFKNDVGVENLTAINTAIEKRQKEIDAGKQKSKASKDASPIQSPKRNSERQNSKKTTKTTVVLPDPQNASTGGTAANLGSSNTSATNHGIASPVHNKGLVTIKEADERDTASSPIKENDKKSAVDSTFQVDKKTAAFRAKIDKAINDIKIPIDISDGIEIDPEIKSSLKEIDNVLLRNLSFITHIYMYACGKETLKEADLQASTISPSVTNETRSQFNNQLQNNKNEAGDEKDKNETVIEYNNIYNNDGYYCLDFEGLWKGIRETGLLSPDFSLATLNRGYYQNPNNYIEMFYLPDEYGDKKTSDVYEYLYDNIKFSKTHFDNKYCKQMNYNAFVADEQEPKTSRENGDDDMAYRGGYQGHDIHDKKNVILIRYFYEMMIRISFGKYHHLTNLTLDKKMKMGFNGLKHVFKFKKRTLENSGASITVLDIKLKNFEPAGDAFKKENNVTLREMFDKIYKSSIVLTGFFNHSDKTFTYRYFYQSIVLRCEKGTCGFSDKTKFMQGITIYHKDKLNGSNTSSLQSAENRNHSHKKNSFSNVSNGVPGLNEAGNNIDVVNYIESLFDIEIIFYEFVEMIFFISKMYFAVNKKAREDYGQVLMGLRNAIEGNATEANAGRGKGSLVYPKGQKHWDIETIKAEEKERKEEEDRFNADVMRYTEERREMKVNDVNTFTEEEEKRTENNSESDFGYD